MHAQAKHANSMLEELWLELKPRTLLLRGNRTNNHQADFLHFDVLLKILTQ